MHDMYSASHKESVMMPCCFELQEIGPLPQSIKYPKMDLQSSDMAQLDLAKEQKMGVTCSKLL